MIRLRVVLALFFGVFAVSLLPAALVDAGDPAQHSNSPTGTTRPYPGVAPCNTTLQACISGSTDGDSIQIAANTYLTSSLTITRAVSLIGNGADPSAVKLRPTSGRMIQYSVVPLTATFVISNLTVENGNSGGSSGGGIRVSSGAAPLFYNIVVSNNIGTGGGGIRIIPSIPVTLINVTVFSNTSASAAGGVSASGDLTLIDSRVERNTASSDGGGANVAGNLTLFNTIVQSNTAGALGGGLYVTGDTIISTTNIISNTGGDGGGVYVTSGLAITNTTFNKNVARTGNGGAIYANSSVTITLASTKNPSATQISSNVAITNGGGVFAQGNVVLVGNVSFNSNQATKGDGGGIYANTVSDASGGLLNTTIALNLNSANINGGGIRALGNVTLTTFPAIVGNHTISTTGDGGAIYADGNVIVVSGFSQADSAHNGGIIYAGGNVSIKQHAASQSSARQDGGCVYAVGNLEVLNDEFFRCSAGRNGGVFFAGQTVTITGAYIGSVIQFPGYQQNVAAKGGLVYGSKVILRSVAPFSNTASIEGGSVYAASTADISATTFTSNTAGYAGGAVVVSGTAWITSSIFSANRMTGTVGFGGGVWVTGTLALSNTDFFSNTALAFQAQGGGAGASGSIHIIGGSFQGNNSTSGAGVFGRKDVTANGTLFDGNNGPSNASGGGMVAITATVTGITMTRNQVCCTGSTGGGISATLAIITGSTFLQNSGFISGGAVIANKVFITNSWFISNTGTAEGAGVWTKGGAITNTQFIANNTGCCSGNAGGAMYVRGQIFVYGSQFTQNRSDHGGAIFMQGSQSEIHGSTFTNNSVDCCDGGGAIDAVGFFPAIYNSAFSGNFVICCDGGGAIRASDLLYVESSTFSNNSANVGDGGAIKRLVGSNNTTFITASTFISNYSATGGGAVFGKQADIENSTFISNHVASFAIGGAVDLFGSSFIGGDSFTDNRVDVPVGACSSGLGGAVYQDQSGSVIVQNSGFSRNSAPRGGALFAGSGGSIELSTFNDNSAFCLDGLTLSNIGSGGAVDTRGSLSVKRSTFIHNSAGSVGGGAIAFLPLNASSLHVENSLFARNVATNTVFGAIGAAIAVTNANTTQLFYNTFANGSTQNSVSAIGIYSGTVSIIDNIIANHAIGIQTLSSGAAFENFNLFFNNTSNTGGGVSSGGSSLTNNPLFASAATDNYHLNSTSPAIDAATDLGITVDDDGQTRPNGGGFDIGAYEYYEVPIVGLSAFNDSPTTLSHTTHFTASVISGNSIVYTWNFGDGLLGSGETTTHTYASVGQYTAIVTASNSLSTVSATTPVTITNLSPIANAGPDQSVLISASVGLDGSASTDPDNHTPLSYRWTQTSGTAVVLSSKTISQPNFTAPSTPSVLRFTLNVTDARGLPNTIGDTVVITVSDVAEVPIAGLTAINDSPTLINHTTRLTATVASGTNVSYTWNFGDGTPFGNQAKVTHTYATFGNFTAIVTATNSTSTVMTTTLVEILPNRIYLPLVLKQS